MNIQGIININTPAKVTQSKKVNSFKAENKFERTPISDTFEIKIGYVNDLHGQTNNMMRILSGIKGDLILSGGDNDIGDEKNRPVHDATAKFLNLAGVKATALGNHEMDTKQGDLKETAKKFNGNILAINIEQKPLEEQEQEELENFNKADIKEFIKPSMIVNVKGEKIGLIGTTPVDLTERATHPDYHKDCKAHDLETTTDLIQNEINKLKKQGVNKIILLSHLGIARDKEVGGPGIWAAIALSMMFMGPIGMAAFPPEYFGIFERFSTVAAVGYNAVLGVYLFDGFKKAQGNM